MRKFLDIAKALADPTRLRVLLALRQWELCACQITALFSFTPSTMSKHLCLLKQAGLVNCRRSGRWIYYGLPGKEMSTTVREALDWVRRSLACDPRIAEDQENLKKVLKCDPADLCRKQQTR